MALCLSRPLAEHALQCQCLTLNFSLAQVPNSYEGTPTTSTSTGLPHCHTPWSPGRYSHLLPLLPSGRPSSISALHHIHQPHLRSILHLLLVLFADHTFVFTFQHHIRSSGLRISFVGHQSLTSFDPGSFAEKIPTPFRPFYYPIPSNQIPPPIAGNPNPVPSSSVYLSITIDESTISPILHIGAEKPPSLASIPHLAT